MDVGTQITVTTEGGTQALTVTGRIDGGYLVCRTGFATVGRGVLDLIGGNRVLIDQDGETILGTYRLV